MSQTRREILVTLLMLLIAINQAAAFSTHACDMDSSSPGSDSVAMEMDHTGHSMGHDADPADSTSIPLTPDCCGQDCSCELGACSATALPIRPHGGRASPPNQQRESQYRLLSLSHISSSLYRPPISQ